MFLDFNLNSRQRWREFFLFLNVIIRELFILEYGRKRYDFHL